jgi:porin
VTFAYTGDLVGDASGGARRGSAFAGAAAVQLTARLGRLVGWRGARAFVFLLDTHGGAPSAVVGDVQGVSNLQASPRLRLEEAWVEQALFRNRLSLLAGRYDVNSEFYRLQSGALFLNSSFGMGPELAQSGVAGPSIFPETSLGTRADVKPSPNTVGRVAVIDAIPADAPGHRALRLGGDGALLLGEAALLARPDTSPEVRDGRFRVGRVAPRTYTGKLAIGGWYYTGRFPAADPVGGAGEPRRGSGGVYLIADQTVWSAPAERHGTATIFAQLGVGDRRANRIGRYAGGGATAAGVVPTRPRDMIGFAVASAHLEGRRAETTLELTYDAPFGTSLTLQPNLQYVIHPGNATASRAIVPALRVAFSR